MTAPGELIALTMGDPAGIGPEITLSAWRALRETGPAFVLIGDPDTAQAAAKSAGMEAPRIVETVTEAADAFPDALPVLACPAARPVTPGKPDPDNAPAVLDSIRRAVHLTLDGETVAVATNPIAKSVLYEHGFAFPGHTEYLAHLTEGAPWDGPRGPVMMLSGGGLRTALVTIHIGLAEAARTITQSRIKAVARVVHDALKRDFGIAVPRIALAGLNPHAGEGGRIGVEEKSIINPAAAALRSEGIDISDARPADTMFHEEARAGYDAAICMYHDQGLIPVKTLDFHGGVNLTLGLPIARTSPDHGTAFDIAGQGKARADSLIAALRLAGETGARRRAA